MEYIERKTLLYKTGVEYGDFTLNHVFGCSHGCLYPCYAMNLCKRYGSIKSYDDWIKPKLVINALDLLDKELPRLKDKIKFVHMCFTTDPFMYGFNEVKCLSLQIIEKINSFNIPVEVLTKGVLPEEIIKYSSHKNNVFGITLVSLSEDFRKKYEPNSAPINERILSLKKCHDKGLKTWVSIEPYPTPALFKQDLIPLLEKIKFVDYIVFGKLNYNTLNSSFKNKENFYNDMCTIVERFCNENNIKLHIKKGTDKRNGC